MRTAYIHMCIPDKVITEFFQGKVIFKYNSYIVTNHGDSTLSLTKKKITDLFKRSFFLKNL